MNVALFCSLFESIERLLRRSTLETVDYSPMACPRRLEIVCLHVNFSSRNQGSQYEEITMRLTIQSCCLAAKGCSCPTCICCQTH